MPDRQRSGRAAGLALAATALAAVLWASGILDPWENATWDWRARVTTGAGCSSAASDSIAVILLNQASLDWGENSNALSWPWPREVVAQIVNFCRRGGAASIAFDVLYTEHSGYGVDDDLLFGEAIAAAGNFVGAQFVSAGAGGGGPVVTEPVEAVTAHARLVANVSDVPDPDGVFRRATLVRWVPGPDGVPRAIPSLAAAAYALARPGAFDVTALPERPVLRWIDPVCGWPTFEAAEVIRSEVNLLEGEAPSVDPDVVRGRHVLFGYGAPGLMDQRPTPLSRVSPGVNVHATALANLLTDGFVVPAPAWLAVAAMVVLAWLAAILILAGRSAWLTGGAIVAALAAPAGLSLLAAVGGIWWPLVPTTAATGASLGGALLLAWATEGRQKRFIRQAFRHYLSPDVIAQILEDPGRLKLGGERRELSIFFSDLEGFTTISERLDPQDLTGLLNEYLTDMTDIILETGGTLDKYEGDAIIAFWNAPADQPDHAIRACRAAVLCQRRLAARRDEFTRRFGVRLRMRIGLNSGSVTVGNLGSHQRFDYTVLGDAANLAARLEGANKVFGTDTMASRDTLAAAGDGWTVRELGALRVVGRSEPVIVHELAGLADEPEPASWDAFRRGLELCRRGEATAAREVFSALSDDPAAAAWARRLAGEVDGFDPVWNLTSK